MIEFDDDTSGYIKKIRCGDVLVIKNTGQPRWFEIRVVGIKEIEYPLIITPHPEKDIYTGKEGAQS